MRGPRCRLGAYGAVSGTSPRFMTRARNGSACSVTAPWTRRKTLNSWGMNPTLRHFAEALAWGGGEVRSPSGTPCRRRSSPTTHPYPSQPNPPNPFLGDALRSVLAMTSVLGINPRESPWNGPAVHAQRSERALDALVSGALEERARARASGDFASADAIRDMLMTAGVVVSDAAEGTSWSLGARHPPRAQQVGVRPRGAR